VFYVTQSGTPEIALSTYKEWEKEVTEDLDRQLTSDERKNIQSHVYALASKSINFLNYPNIQK